MRQLIQATVAAMTALPTDFAGRVRAARAYADVTNQSDFGDLLSVSGTTVKNYENGSTKPDDRAVTETIRRLASASKLPEWFFTVPSLNGLRSGDRTADQRLSQLEETVRHLQVELAAAEVEAQRRHEEAIAAIRQSRPPQQL